ncbi:MAG TPA: cell envelope integrity protein TolA [Bosea sp. (in: a-proteobacteria)]|uniref:cell envelope integrity protein TolA n=1 Tax=Bosea sp. (in: a-proteobacteria) TaxID=1871050 RepID=UPI002DDCC8DE|nr:cell envelope integrity protein TolA [Bosea sp. (in: a-proteobacteria)]HEV2552475.1 cell envelope integrity protein TolA [Bosea sp. (in: a-proteobacteria)]
MKLSSEPGMVVSALGHATFLVAGLLAFSSPAPLPDNEEAIAVEMVDASALNQVTRGERKAEKVQEQPLQRAERQAEIVERKEEGEAKQDAPAPPSRPAELKTAEDNAAAPLPPSRAANLPKPEVKPPEPVKQPPQKSGPSAAEIAEQKREELAKLAEEAELASKAKQAEEAARAAAKAKAEAEANARAEAAAKAKAEAVAKAEAEQAAKEKVEAAAKAKAEAEAKAKIAAAAKAKQEAEAKARREMEIAKNFNPSDISKLLQSKERAQSTGSAAPQVNRTASLGTERGSSQKLSPSLRGQLIGIIQDQLMKCWNVPIALANARGAVVPQVRMKLAADGSLLGQPGVVNSSSDPLFSVAASSALTATRRCAPLRIPAQFAAYYDDWRDVIVNFDARDVL